jgi:hypothetical protein
MVLNFAPFETDHAFKRPSGTGRLSASLPGTSCPATIGLSLRDGPSGTKTILPSKRLAFT